MSKGRAVSNSTITAAYVDEGSVIEFTVDETWSFRVSAPEVRALMFGGGFDLEDYLKGQFATRMVQQNVDPEASDEVFLSQLNAAMGQDTFFTF